MSSRISNQSMYVKAIVYDLPSENIREIANDELRDRVRAVRVSCTYMLHSLGVQCTESVILVSPEKVDRIDEAITYVKTRYESLSREIRLQLTPIIEVLDLTQSQFDRLIPIAKQRLLRVLDDAIDRVSEAITRLRIESDERVVQRIIRNLRRVYRDWERVYRLARSLGIDISRDYEYLISLLEGATQ